MDGTARAEGDRQGRERWKVENRYTGVCVCCLCVRVDVSSSFHLIISWAPVFTPLCIAYVAASHQAGWFTQEAGQPFAREFFFFLVHDKIGM